MNYEYRETRQKGGLQKESAKAEERKLHLDALGRGQNWSYFRMKCINMQKEFVHFFRTPPLEPG